MATQKNSNPLAGLYEAQTAATAELVEAALNGMQRLQRLTLQAMRAGASGQMSMAQSMSNLRDGGDVNRAVSDAAGPAAEQGARYQRELLQAISEMNNDLVRASYSMMERMRKAFSDVAQEMPRAMASTPAMAAGSDAMSNPLALYDSAMRQWQSAVQQLMEASPMTMPTGARGGTRGSTERAQPAKSSTRQSARKKR